MIPCLECGVYFFTNTGRADHNNYCIGYHPKNEGENMRRSVKVENRLHSIISRRVI
jgi:hypothetical protein